MSKITEILDIDQKLQQVQADQTLTGKQARLIARELGSNLPPSKTCPHSTETRRIVAERIHQFVNSQETDASAGKAAKSNTGASGSSQKSTTSGRGKQTQGANKGKAQSKAAEVTSEP